MTSTRKTAAFRFVRGNVGLAMAVGLALLVSPAGTLYGGSNATLELKTSKETIQGRLLSLGKDVCHLLGRDGRLHAVALDEVQSFREINSAFSPLKSAEVRDQLRREFGQEYEVAGSEHYVVCAPRGKGQQYAQVFEEVYRGFRGYFSTRGFGMSKPEFPLVAVVLTDSREFAAYAKQDRVAFSPGLQGYYLPVSNRVALFERNAATSSLPPRQWSIAGLPADPAARGAFRIALPEAEGWEWREPLHASIRSNGNVDASLRDVMIHEATHQAAFNTGLHSRIGANPRWIVEGLATVFEAPGVRSSQKQGAAVTRINRDRYVWFRNFMQARRPAKSLQDFVAGDALYQSGTLDFYAQAWALSFYLIETRPSEYARYLKRIAGRDPLQPYAEAERLDDFASSFGHDLNLLDAKFLRFIEQIE